MYVYKRSLKLYHQSLKNQVNNADSQKFDAKTKLIKKRMEIDKLELEKITNNYNIILSASVKKRGEIKALRKERTLYDHIFKTLEYQILNQERKLYKIIKKNHKQDILITESQANLESIKELASKNNYDDFYKLVEDEKKKYVNNLNQLKNEFKGSKEIYLSLFDQRKTLNQNKMSLFIGTQRQRPRIQQTKEFKDLIDVNNKIEFFESIQNNFKFYTNSEDIDSVLMYWNDAEKLNEKLYSEFCELEDEYDDITDLFEHNKRIVEKRDLHSISTKVSKTETKAPVTRDDLQQQMQESNKELAHLLVC